MHGRLGLSKQWMLKENNFISHSRPTLWKCSVDFKSNFLLWLAPPAWCILTKMPKHTHTQTCLFIFPHTYFWIHTSPQLSFLRAQSTSHLSTHTFKREHVIFAKSSGCEIGRCQHAASIWTHRAHGSAQEVQLSPSLPWHINTQLCKTELCDILAEFPLLRAPDCLFLNLFLCYSDRVSVYHPINNEQHQLDLFIYLWGFHLLFKYTIHNAVCTF